MIAVVMALVAAHPATADPVARWQPLMAEAAQRFAIPQAWVERVMRAESAGHTELNGHAIRSRAGAIGLMQLMPGTWEAMRRDYNLGPDPDDPRDNILAGTAYLRLMYDRFGYPGLFGAYNAGPTRYAAWLAGRQYLPGETIAYLGAVAGPGRMATIRPDSPPRQLLFALRRGLDITAQPTVDRPVVSGLFAIRKGSE
ncbi:lytic transglycosylase domain-containing protein [soil metagenome]